MTSDIKDFYPYFLGALFAAFILILWYFSCLAIEQSLVPKYWQNITQFIATLFATVIGAYLAFKYRTHEKINEITEKQVESLNNAIITLARQSSLIKGVKKKVENKNDIQDFKNDIRENSGQKLVLNKSELRIPEGSVVYININSLTFLIKNKNDDLIKNIVDSESNLNALLTEIDICNYYCNHEIETMLENEKASVKELNSKISEREMSLLQKAEESLCLIEVVLNKIQDISKAQFPNNTFISF